MTDTSALENLKYAHACDVALDLSSQDVHELWADIEARGRHIAELKESDKHWAGNVKVCMQLIERYESAIAELEAENETLKTACDILRGDNNLLFKRLMSIETPDDLQTLKIVYVKEGSEVQE